MWKKLLLGALTLSGLLLIQACGRQYEPEESCNFVQNASMQRVSWRDRTPAKLYVHQSVPPEFYQGIKRAVKTWNDRLGREVLRIEQWGVSGKNMPSRDGYSVIYWLDEWEDDRHTEQARTTIFWTGKQIYEADIRLNNKHFDFYEGEDQVFSGVHLESLMLHELGHVLGLAHTRESESVMVTSLGSGQRRSDPSNSDLHSLRCEY